MQYITQLALATKARNTPRLSQREQLYLLSHIVKEQPIDTSKRSTNQSRARTQLIADSSTSRVAGGANRDRTDDLLLAKQALSQLSYGPAVPLHALSDRARVGGSGWIRTIDPRLIKTVL